MYSGSDTFIDDNQKSEAAHPGKPACPTSKFQLSKVGFPIRKSAGQRPFAPHRSLSQRTTSFIASYRQGIHQMLLGHLIALISNAHPMPKLSRKSAPALGWRTLLLERPEVIRDKPSDRSRGQAPQARMRLSIVPRTARSRAVFKTQQAASNVRLGSPTFPAYLLFTMSMQNHPGLLPRDGKRSLFTRICFCLGSLRSSGAAVRRVLPSRLGSNSPDRRG
jgi:hypothetical protein